jgi:PHIKZ080
MDKLDYYKMGLKKGWFKDAFWVKSCLSLFYTEDTTHYLVRRDKGYFYCYDENGNEIKITGNNDTNTPLLRVGEMLTLTKGEVPNITKETRTSVGCLLMNYLLTIDPFKGKVPYINKRFSPRSVEPYFLLKWTRSEKDVTENEPAKEGEIFTEEYLTFANNALHLTNYCQTVNASVTKKALMTNPIVEKRRLELYKEHEHELNDPVVQAKIDEELVKLDKEYLKDDESMGFLGTSGKTFSNVRRRLNNHFGAPKGLTDKDEPFIERPLRKGIDLERFSLYTNDAYSGSISRGLETQEGGVKTKDAIRSAANLKVAIDDCGSRIGEMVQFSKDIEKNRRYIGYYYLENKKTIKITEDNLASLSGRLVEMRSPAYCIAKNSSFCKCCVGPNVANYPNGIVTVNARITSIIMNLSLKAMHVSGTAISKWKFDLIS